MTDDQSAFQLGRPDQLSHPVPPPPAPPDPSDPPRSPFVRFWDNPPRVAFLIALLVVIVILAVLYTLRDGDDEPLPVKDFDLAAMALEVEPVESWTVHELSAATIRLPARFDVFEIDMDLVLELGLGALGSDWTQYVEFAAEETTLEQFFYDREGGLPSGVMVYVMTMHTNRRATAQQIVNDLNRSRVPRGIRVIDSAVVELNGVEAARWVIEMSADVAGMDLSFAQYYVMNNDTRTAWLVNCASPTPAFEDWLAIFQAAARTLTFTPAN